MPRIPNRAETATVRPRPVATIDPDEAQSPADPPLLSPRVKEKLISVSKAQRETVRTLVLGIQARRRFKMLKRTDVLHAFVIDKAVREIKKQYSGFRKLVHYLLIMFFCSYLLLAQMPTHFSQYAAADAVRGTTYRAPTSRGPGGCSWRPTRC